MDATNECVVSVIYLYPFCAPLSGAQRDISGPYKWQLEDGHGWKDIANDHILEGQYSQPNIKGINIYNTPYG